MAGLPPALDPAADVQGQAEAAAILDELDWTMQRGQRRRGSTGLRLALMWNEASPQARGVARAVRDAWGELGVRVPSASASWSYLMGPLRRGEFEVGLGRLAERSDADLYEYFHSRGELNVPGVADADLDAALEAYRAASTPQQRVEAKTAIATRLAELQPVSVLHAPTAVLVASRRLLGLTFEDDLPRLTGLDLAPPREWELVRR
jgi:ABC-type transport system substrate-binding protein